MRARLRALDPNVRNMGWVSFVADLSSEIVYPLFPLFVTGVLGAPVAVLGLIEGIAEATATVSATRSVSSPTASVGAGRSSSPATG